MDFFLNCVHSCLLFILKTVIMIVIKKISVTKIRISCYVISWNLVPDSTTSRLTTIRIYHRRTVDFFLFSGANASGPGDPEVNFLQLVCLADLTHAQWLHDDEDDDDDDKNLKILLTADILLNCSFSFINITVPLTFLSLDDRDAVISPLSLLFLL